MKNTLMPSYHMDTKKAAERPVQLFKQKLWRSKFNEREKITMKLTFLLSTSWHKKQKVTRNTKCSPLLSPQSKLSELTLFTNGAKVQAQDFSKNRGNGMIEKRLGPLDNLFSQRIRNM